MATNDISKSCGPAAGVHKNNLHFVCPDPLAYAEYNIHLRGPTLKSTHGYSVSSRLRSPELAHGISRLLKRAAKVYFRFLFLLVVFGFRIMSLFLKTPRTIFEYSLNNSQYLLFWLLRRIAQLPHTYEPVKCVFCTRDAIFPRRTSRTAFLVVHYTDIGFPILYRVEKMGETSEQQTEFIELKVSGIADPLCQEAVPDKPRADVLQDPGPVQEKTSAEDPTQTANSATNISILKFAPTKEEQVPDEPEKSPVCGAENTTDLMDEITIQRPTSPILTEAYNLENPFRASRKTSRTLGLNVTPKRRRLPTSTEVAYHSQLHTLHAQPFISCGACTRRLSLSDTEPPRRVDPDRRSRYSSLENFEDRNDTNSSATRWMRRHGPKGRRPASDR